MPEKLFDISGVRVAEPEFDISGVGIEPKRKLIKTPQEATEKTLEFIESLYPKEKFKEEVKTGAFGFPAPKAVGKQILKGVAKAAAQLPMALAQQLDAVLERDPILRGQKIMNVAEGMGEMVVKSVTHPIRTFEEEPEALVGTALIATGLKSAFGRASVKMVNDFWAEEIGIPTGNFVARITPSAVRKYFVEGRITRDPELANIIRAGEGKKFVLKTKLKEATEKVREVKEAIKSQYGVSEKTAEFRTRQLLTQMTVPYGKFPKGFREKAGITMNEAVQKKIDFVKEVEIEIGAEAVRMGLLDSETYLRNVGGHLFRTYLDYLQPKGFRRFLPSRPVRVGLKEFEQRGAFAIEKEQVRLQKEIAPLQQNIQFLEKTLDRQIDKNIAVLQRSIARSKRVISKEQPELRGLIKRKQAEETTPASLEAIERTRTEKLAGYQYFYFNKLSGKTEPIPLTVDVVDLPVRSVNELIVKADSKGNVLDIKQHPQAKTVTPTIREKLETSLAKTVKLSPTKTETFPSELQQTIQEGTKIAQRQKLIEELKQIDVSKLDEPVLKAIRKRVAELERMKETAQQRIDFPLNDQFNMGLVLDPEVSLVYGGLRTINDIGNFQIMKEILGNPRKASSTFTEGYVEFKKPGAFDAQMWKELTGKKGDQPMWIEPETFKDAFDFMAVKSDVYKSYRGFVNSIQKLLTIKDPFFIPVNVIGNIMGVEAGKGSPIRYIKNVFAPDQAFKNARTELLKAGYLETVYEFEMSKYLPQLTSQKPIIQQLPTIFDKLTDLINFGKAEELGRFNSYIDQVGKVEIYQSALEQGLSKAEALAKIDKFTVTPRNIPKFAQDLRAVGIPSIFISFPFEYAKIVKNMVKEHPTKAIKWIALPIIMKEVFREQQNISEEELKTAYKQLPPFRRGLVNMMIPIRKEDGGIALVDLSNIFPWTSFLSLAGNYRGLASNPLFDWAMAISTSRNPETGKKIVRPGEKNLESFTKRWADRTFSIAPQYRKLKTIQQAIQGQTYRGQSKDPFEFVSVFSPVKYVDLSQMDLTSKIGYLHSLFKETVQDQLRIKRDFADKKIDERTYKLQIETIQKEAEEIRKQIQQAVQLIPQGQ